MMWMEKTHELTFSCYRNQKLLLSDRICQWLIGSIERAREKHHFSLWAFVFMPDHVYLLISPGDEEYNISNILKVLKLIPRFQTGIIGIGKKSLEFDPVDIRGITVRIPACTAGEK